MTRSTRSATLAAAVAMVAPAAAQAHVTLQPKEAQAGSYAVETVRVPNETSDATTTKVEVRMPPGFTYVAYQPVPGWTAKLRTSKLAEPEETEDGPVTEQVDQVTFTAADGKGIAPGQFQDFPLSMKLPDAAGKVTFKALQTYDDGDVVRWIGAPDSEEPAPQVALTAAAASSGGAASGGAASGGAAVGATPARQVVPDATGDDDGTDGLTVVALVLGGLGLLAGVGALAAARRRPALA